MFGGFRCLTEGWDGAGGGVMFDSYSSGFRPSLRLQGRLFQLKSTSALMQFLEKKPLWLSSFPNLLDYSDICETVDAGSAFWSTEFSEFCHCRAS